MWRNRHFNRPVFLTICFSILVLAAAVSLLIWHSLTQPPTPPHATRPPTPPQATCGTVVFGGAPGRPVDTNAQHVERCFYDAYQQCAARSMEVGELGVDTGSSTLYWSYQQGTTCQIITQSSSFGLVGRTNSAVTDTCQSVIPKNGGLLFQHCGTSGNVFIAG